jgi:transcriptional antiterminator RfaH
MNSSNSSNPTNSSNSMNSSNPSNLSNSSNPRLAWYVIQTKPKKEEDAKSYLSMKGLEIFNPLMENFVIRNGVVTKEYRPLFPGYMFGKFDLEQDYSLVRWGRGVKKVLSLGGGYPTPLAEEVIEVIKRRTDSNGIVRKTYHFEANDRIRIKSGPLKDLLGIFERWVSDSERVRVLLNLIGYHPEVELHYSMIEKVA